MTWDEYYEKINDWAVSTSVKKMTALENVGAASEVADVINILASEDAEQEIVNAQSALQSLNCELKWILRNKDVQLASNKLASVADMTFNSRVLDSLVHLQIGKSQHQISKAIRKVEAVRQELVRMYKKYA